jgi:tetratricopeptide (TPR) repeat protein
VTDGRRASLLDRAAWATLAAWGVTLLAVALAAHRTPTYGAESDLIGEYIPAAQDVRAGLFRPEHYLFRGPGYPVLLALASLATSGDYFLAARWLNVVAAIAAAALAWRLVRRFLGAPVALATLLGLLANPTFVRATIEAATDMPALALSLASVWLLLDGAGPGAAAGAGALGGAAFLARDNSVFLLPAAALVLVGRSGRRWTVPSYALAFLIPLGAWGLVQWSASGGLFPSHNYLNVAYEVYGRDRGWEQYWLESGTQFHSFLDVWRLDPGRCASRLVTNLGTRWWQDASRLMPIWIGALAAPGMVLTWWRRPGWRDIVAHVVLCYAVLALVFYAPRFFLFLLPFYLSGAFGLLVAPRLDDGRMGAGARRLRIVGLACAGAAIVASGVSAGAGVARMLAEAPDEARVAGERLHALGRPGVGVMARKPLVAYYAGMRFVPLPDLDNFGQLLQRMRSDGARYLLISPVEVTLRSQFSVLVDPEVSLPGLDQIGHSVEREGHFYALYRLAEAPPSPVLFEDSLLAAIERYAVRRPGDPWPRIYLAGQLLSMGRYRVALAVMPSADSVASDPLAARIAAVAHGELGEYDLAAAACERGLASGADPTWARAYLGHVRRLQGRAEEARDLLRDALRAAPANLEYLEEYALASLAAGDPVQAATAFERVLGTQPADATTRLRAAHAWLEAGRPDRARALLAWPGTSEGPDRARLLALADSLARRPRS